MKYIIEIEKLPNGEFQGSMTHNGTVENICTHPDVSWMLAFLSGQVVSKFFGSPIKALTAYLRAAVPKRKKAGDLVSAEEQRPFPLVVQAVFPEHDDGAIPAIRESRVERRDPLEGGVPHHRHVRAKLHAARG